MMPDQLRLMAMQAALVEGYGETSDTCWVGDNTLVVAAMSFGRTHIRTFDRKELLDWFSRAWDFGFDSPDAEFSDCVAATAPSMANQHAIADQREVA